MRFSLKSQGRTSRIVTAIIVMLLAITIGVLNLPASRTASTSLYTGKLLGVNASLGDLPAAQTDVLNPEMGVNSERGDIEFNGTSFNDPEYDNTVADWIDTMTANHIVPLPLLNQYIELTNLNATAFTSSAVAWCKAYCAGGTFYSGNSQANASYAPQVLEILNEPYGGGSYWGNSGPYTNANPTPADVAAYATLLIDLRSALNSAGLTNIGILAAANNNWDTTENWDTELLNDGGFAAAQGVTMHAYGDDGAIQIPAGTVGQGIEGWSKVYYIHQFLANAGLSTQAGNIYVTEDGWCTTSCSPAVSESVKDANIGTAISQVATVPWIKGFWYFNLHPCCGTDWSLFPTSSSVISEQSTPAAYAFQQAATKVNAEYPSEFTLSTSPTPTPTPPPTPTTKPTPTPTSTSTAGQGVHVVGNQLVDGNGNPLQLRGVDRSGTEFACIQGWGIFDGPSDAASIAAMKTWDINAVRVPLNEDCWLNINGVDSQYGGAAYQSAIVNWVNELNSAGLTVVLDLHLSAPGTYPATSQQVMADADHSPTFWSSVASTFKSNHDVIFDLYNEPHIDTGDAETSDPWSCWLNGCTIDAGNGISSTWQSAGMQSLVNAVRGTGATQPIMVGGLDWANDLSGFLSHKPNDPDGQLVASLHMYSTEGCVTATCWNGTLAPVAAAVPIVTGELGEHDCASSFIDSFMDWADAHGVSYLGWAWNDDMDCSGGPSLITDYNGTPSGMGVGFKAHLLAVAGAPTPTPTPTPSPTSTPTSTVPVLTVSGDTISWSAIPGAPNYTLATVLNPSTTRNTTYSTVSCCSVTPQAVPGQTVNYGLAVDLPGASWAKEVTITYPASKTSTTITLTSSTSSTQVDHAVTFTVHVTPGSATGSVRFVKNYTSSGGGTVMCAAAPVVDGVATCSITFYADYVHTMYAQFTGTENYGNSSITMLQTVAG